jgi:hypothetical protein
MAADRIRDYDFHGMNWKNFPDINFVNMQYWPFDASGWKIWDAGITGPAGKIEIMVNGSICLRGSF